MICCVLIQWLAVTPGIARDRMLLLLVFVGLILSESLQRTECVSMTEGVLIPDWTVIASHRMPVRIVMTYLARNVVCGNVSLFTTQSYELWYKDIYYGVVRG